MEGSSANWKGWILVWKKTCPRNVCIITNSRLIHIYRIYTAISTPSIDANKEMKKKWSHFSSKWWNFHHSRHIRPQWEIYFKTLRGLLGNHTMSSIVGCTLTAWFKPRSALSSGVILMAFKLLPTICPIQKYTITTLPLKKWVFF